MNPGRTILLFTLLAGALAGQEKPTTAVIPQPRPRLNPVAVAAAGATGEKQASDAAIVVLDRFIVKAEGVVPTGPKKEAEPEGKFSPLRGGRFFGNARVEVGLWPYVDMFEKDARFKPQKTSVGLDFLRIKW